MFGELEKFGVAVAEAVLDDSWHGLAGRLFDDEAVEIESVVTRRRIEFIASRTLAHSLMRIRQWPVRAVPRGPDRSPQWPTGLCGSITHTDTRCAVAIAADNEIWALGLDLEPLCPIEPHLWEMICRPAEFAALKGLDFPPAMGTRVRCLFSAKEAFYKAWYPRTGRFLGHHDLSVTLQPASSTFDIEVHVADGDGDGEIVGPKSHGLLSFGGDHIGAAWVVTCRRRG